MTKFHIVFCNLYWGQANFVAVNKISSNIELISFYGGVDSTISPDMVAKLMSEDYKTLQL